MQYFDELLSVYSLVDSELALHEETAREDNDRSLEASIKRKRELNDQAYFLLLFAQFEYFINEQCTNLIRDKSNIANWIEKRPWYILDHRNITRMEFMNRVALLTEKGHATYNKIYEYYTNRNKSAHGSLLSTSAPLPAIADDLQNFSTEFRH